MPTKPPPIGEKFNRLTVRGLSDKTTSCKAYWLCECDCGEFVEPSAYAVRSGYTKSCGCQKLDTCKLGNSRRKHGLSDTDEYNILRGVIDRCTNRFCPGFEYYGGQGVKVAEHWLGDEGLLNFIADIGPRPSRAYSIDRYPNQQGNYEPGNVRWATKKEQMRNFSRNRLLTYNNRTQCIAAWVEETGIPRSAIYRRMELGWSVEVILTTPVKHRK